MRVTESQVKLWPLQRGCMDTVLWFVSATDLFKSS